MDEVARMDEMQATELDTADMSPLVTGCNQITYQLPSQERDCLDRELKTPSNKKILEGWAETIKHHCIETGFHTKPMDTGDPSPYAKLRIDMILVIQGVILSFHRLEFNNDILPRQDIFCKIYFICSQVCEPNKRGDTVPQTYERLQTSFVLSSYISHLCE